MSDLTLDHAQSIVAQAMVKATQDFGGRPICVAVCDERGLLLAFARMDGAPARGVRISQGKAYSAARMGMTTQAVLERLHREKIEIGYFCDPEITALPGGSPLRNGAGRMVGAVGVSGLTSAEDQSVTDAMATGFSAS